MDEKKSGKIRRKRVSFAQVSNTALRDSTLSLKAKGLLGIIESYLTLDNFTLYRDFLISKSKDGETAFRAAWKELKDHGYLIQYKLKDESCHFYYEYEICDDPQVENPHVEIPPEENLADRSSTCSEPPLYNNTVHSNTISNNTIYVNIIRTNIDYDPVFVNSLNRDVVDNIVDIMADVLSGNCKAYKINGNDVSGEVVKSVFNKVNMNHINYVVNILENYQTKVSNIKNFIISVVYNSVLTLDSYYTNIINQ